ncbi:MAG: hypothetical protein ACTHNZ_13585 [Trinickia sp.]|uniref:hypothetical protein n=1 Tax=Trinickia sp. TaxID=2571163 RepID=UPI003F8133D3
MSDTSHGVRLADAPKLGEYWRGQGGLYAGVIPDYEGNHPRVLIVADDQAIDVPWGGSGDVENGAHDRADGYANTRALIDCKVASHFHHAARFAWSYEQDGHDDFHLPSQRELDALNVTMPDTFDQTDWYWSSTERSSAMAWGRNFGGATIDTMLKHMPGRALAVRSVPVIEDAPCTVSECTSGPA